MRAFGHVFRCPSYSGFIPSHLAQSQTDNIGGSATIAGRGQANSMMDTTNSPTENNRALALLPAFSENTKNTTPITPYTKYPIAE